MNLKCHLSLVSLRFPFLHISMTHLSVLAWYFPIIIIITYNQNIIYNTKILGNFLKKNNLFCAGTYHLLVLHQMVVSHICTCQTDMQKLLGIMMFHLVPGCGYPKLASISVWIVHWCAWEICCSLWDLCVLVVSMLSWVPPDLIIMDWTISLRYLYKLFAPFGCLINSYWYDDLMLLQVV